MRKLIIWLTAFAFSLGVTACGQSANQQNQPETSPADSAIETENQQIAGENETVAYEEVLEEGMTPVYADALLDGDYPVEMKSSSSMFSITDCILHVKDGKMTAEMFMGGTGYLYLYPGTAEEAVSHEESDYIPYDENADGVHVFTIPVQALDAEIPCSAYSRKKEKWYDRTLLIRVDSLPADAFAESRFTTVESLGLADGEYTIEVTLEGGSGKASVSSPAKLIISDGSASAEIIWSSNKYDYMLVNGEKFEPVSTEENSVFEIPVSGFDYPMPVSADTTAMSQPYEIEYTLYFDSATVKAS
ncbi:MAG: hypothetical protein E7496_08560 [Ruminococcus sp.]|nr:hypothetical protein [Ruminococcus sp.]